MTVIWADQGDGTFQDYEHAVAATRSALDDLVRHATEHELATDRELADLYATSVMVYACATYRARAVAAVPLRLVDGKGEDVPRTEPLARVFHRGMREIMRRTELTIYFWGRNLLLKRKNPYGLTAGLRWLNPSLWQPETDQDDGLLGFRFTQPIGTEVRSLQTLPPSQFVYMHTIDFADDFDGLAPAEVAFLEGGLEVEMAMTAVNFFRNRAIPALLLQPAKETAEIAGMVHTPEQDNANALASFLRITAKGSQNAGRSIVQPVRWEALTLSQSFKDIAMSELYRENRQQIAIASDIPLELIVPTASNYAQIYDVRRGWYEGWVRPQVEWYAEGFTDQLAIEGAPDWQVVPDFEAVSALKEDAAARQNRVTGRVQAGLLDMGKAAREIDPDQADPILDGLYMVDGVPVPKEHLREIWRAKFGGAAQQESAPATVTAGEGAGTATQVEEREPVQPPRPPSATEGEGEGEGTPPARSAPEPSAEESAAPPPPELPSDEYREIRTYVYVTGRKGATYPFEFRTIPRDTAAYAGLLRATTAGFLSDEELIAAIRADYTRHHLTGEKAYSETALNYRATLLNLVRMAFDEAKLKAADTSAISRQQFGEMGRAEIEAAFRQAFFDGLREVGVNTDVLAEDEEKELQLRIRAERTYFTALANEVYREAIPLYLEALALQEDAHWDEASHEDRATWQRQAVEKYRDFIRVRERIEARIDGYVFKGLEQIHTLGRLYGAKNKMQKWVRDPMKNSCRSCLALDGQVHRAREFLKYVIPQDSRLLCHGDKCGCGLEDTTERARGRLDRVPLNRGAKSGTVTEYMGAAAAKSAGAVPVGFYVSLAGDETLVILRRAIAEAVGSMAGIEWQESLDLHMSLAYAAEPQSPEKVAELIAEWEPEIVGQRPVTATISHLEIWDTENEGRVLVGIVELSEEVADLQSKVAGLLAGHGIEVGEYGQPEKFKPHVTLAYGEGLPDEPPVIEGGAVFLDNVCLVTPDSILTAVPLLTEGEEELLLTGAESEQVSEPVAA